MIVIALIDWFIRNISTHQRRYNNTCSLLYLLVYLASCLACYLLYILAPSLCSVSLSPRSRVSSDLALLVWIRDYSFHIY
jgi:hypothetical protein